MRTVPATSPRRLLTLLFAALLFAALLTLLAACTGTKEPTLPTLLLVGVEEGGVPQLLLIEAVPSASVAAAERLLVVPGSGRELLAPAVALDVSGRDLDRSTAWVLSRAVTTVADVPQVSAYLQSFDVARIDPSDPSAFKEHEGRRRTLTEPAGGGDLDGVGTANPSGHICPTELQVSRSGAYAIILDDPGACGFPSSDFPIVWLLNTASGAARLLSGDKAALNVRPYTDQRPDNERAYFLVGGINTAQVYALSDFASGRAVELSSNAVNARPSDIIDLGGSGSLLVVLGQDGLVTTDLASVSPPPSQKTTATLANPRRLTVDQLGASSQLLVQSSNQVAVHLDASDAEPAKVSFNAHAATIEPLTSWAYFVGNGEMLIVDLLSRLSPDETLRTARQPLAELTLSTGPDGRPLSVITWLLAAQPPPGSP